LIPTLFGRWESSLILLVAWLFLSIIKTFGLKIKSNFLAFVFVFLTRWILFGFATFLLIMLNKSEGLIEILLLISIFVLTYLKDKKPTNNGS